MGDLEAVFKSFCAFGAGKGGEALMDNAKLSKLCRDLKLLDKKFTSTDVDIIFNKVKAKSERKINFAQFQECLRQFAEKKYPSKTEDEKARAEGLSKLTELIVSGKGPKASGVTKATKAGAVDRLTDTSKYTGAHKERFDESGKGKGMEGRVDKADDSGYVGNYKLAGTYDKTKGK